MCYLHYIQVGLSMPDKKLVLVLLGVFLFLVVVVAVGIKFFFGGLTQTTLTYWGLWEPESVYQTVIADYQQKHPNVKIVYQKQSPIQYRERLTSALAQGTGPDIFRFHNSWLPMFLSDLSPVPASVYDPATFRQTFYPAAQKDLLAGGQYYGIPLEIDTLAMYVNQNLFTQSGVKVPSSWPAEFSQAASAITVVNNGRIVRSGAALGNAGNVTHWQDILALMMLQNGVDLTEPTGTLAEDALNYYAGFTGGNQNTWDDTQDESKLAFAKGNLAVYFGYSWDYFDINELAKGNALDMKVFPVPQLPGTTVNYASYWVEGVSKHSKNQATAWDFLKFISSKEELAKLYQAEANLRGFGEPYGRMDMADLLKNDPVVSVFINQAPTAQGWYLDSLTWDGDTGLNSRVGNYFAAAINDVHKGTDVKSALTTASSGVRQVLATYNVISPAAVTPAAQP